MRLSLYFVPLVLEDRLAYAALRFVWFAGRVKGKVTASVQREGVSNA